MSEKGIRVDLQKPFPIIRETLGRIGIANRGEKKLFPSCYIYQKGEDYFISHFKELLKNPDMDEVDYQRRDTIIWLLENWGLLKICCDSEAEEIKNNILKKKLFVLSKDQMENEDWEICHKLHQYGITQYSSID